MKVALFLLLIPCVALGRVGEKLEDFTKRAGVKPDTHWTLPSGYFYAELFVDEVLVSIYGKNGLILHEIYDGLSEEKAKAIIEKLPKSFTVPIGPGQDWRDARVKVGYEVSGKRLRVSSTNSYKATEAIHEEMEKRSKLPKKPDVEKF